MFVRVRNFGVANGDVFPESSGGSQAFDVLAGAAVAIEEHLTRRAEARARARKVRSSTRMAVTNYMKAIAATGRRAADADSGVHPFRMPSRRSAAVLLATARLFMEEAERRRDSFVILGMPPTFITDFQRLVRELEQAIEVQQDSRASRHMAQAGIQMALLRGTDALRTLDVVVANVLRGDPVRLAQWHGARHIEGQGSSSGPAAVPPPEVQAVTEEEEVPLSHDEDHVLDKAS